MIIKIALVDIDRKGDFGSRYAIRPAIVEQVEAASRILSRVRRFRGGCVSSLFIKSCLAIET